MKVYLSISFLIGSLYLLTGCNNQPVNSNKPEIKEKTDENYIFFLHNKYIEEYGVDAPHPEYAKQIASNGLEYLHLVDLSGAKEGKLIHSELMSTIVSQTKLKVDFGGGIKTKGDVLSLFELGANQVVIGSLCVKQPETIVSWIKEFGAEKFILALDTDGEFLKINGWQERSEVTLENTMNFFKEFERLSILTTDIRKDGTGTGPNVVLYKSLVQKFQHQKWIASGGVESITDLQELRNVGCYACVVGKALLDGKITLNELKQFNNGSL